MLRWWAWAGLVGLGAAAFDLANPVDVGPDDCVPAHHAPDYAYYGSKSVTVLGEACLTWETATLELVEERKADVVKTLHHAAAFKDKRKAPPPPDETPEKLLEELQKQQLVLGPGGDVAGPLADVVPLAQCRTFDLLALSAVDGLPRPFLAHWEAKHHGRVSQVTKGLLGPWCYFRREVPELEGGSHFVLDARECFKPCPPEPPATEKPPRFVAGEDDDLMPWEKASAKAKYPYLVKSLAFHDYDWGPWEYYVDPAGADLPPLVHKLKEWIWWAVVGLMILLGTGAAIPFVFAERKRFLRWRREKEAARVDAALHPKTEETQGLLDDQDD